MKKIVLFLVLLFMLSFVILSHMEQETPAKFKIGIDGSTFKDLQFIQKREGQLKLNLYSKEAFLYDGGKQMELKELTIFIPDRDFKVFAQKAFYNLETGNFSLREMIEGTTKDLKIFTIEANWDSKNKVLYSEKPIKIESKKFKVEGGSGKADESLIELKKGVKAIVYSSK